MRQVKKPSHNGNMLRISLIALVVILMWRGVDGLLDIYLFPNNELLSSLLSILLALIIIFLAKIKLKELD